MIKGNLFNFRQLWVNDVKAIRAKSANGEIMHRILNWNKQEAACVIPTLAFANLDEAKGVELFIHQWWVIATRTYSDNGIQNQSTVTLESTSSTIPFFLTANPRFFSKIVTNTIKTVSIANINSGCNPRNQ